MDTEQLRTFVEVVRLGSFAAVARELATDPSAVTRAIAALEKTLGVRLLERTTRRLALTKAGTAYHETVRDLLKDLQRAGDEARDLGYAVALLYSDIEHHYARMEAYAEPEILGDEWVAEPLPCCVKER